MTPQEKVNWFWATGILPGTMFDDLNEEKAKSQVEFSRRRINWLRIISLGLLG